MQCQFHGYDSFNCPDCKKSAKLIESRLIKEGTMCYAVFRWTGTGLYHISERIGKPYKSLKAAEKYAEKLNKTGDYNAVARLVLC